MAVKLISNYAKRLGLPGFSSHQFSVSVETELTDLTEAPAEIARLYHSLQESVDREIRQTGFIPGDGYGELPQNGTATPSTPTRKDWNCSDKQHHLIGELAEELGLSDDEVDARSARLFDKPAHRLDKLGASGLISDLLAEAGKRRQRNGRSNGSNGNGSRRGNHARAGGNGGSGR